MLKEFYVKFKEDGFQFMTVGKEYLVTFNGAHHGSYRGYDDNGTAFCYSIDVFFPVPMTATQVTARNMRASKGMRPISKPDDSKDYTHMGRYRGPKGRHYTTDADYNLIYEDATDSVSVRDDIGNWNQLDGDMFTVTHNYGRGGPVPNMPTHSNAAVAAPVPIMHDDDLDAAGWDDGCDMTGISVTEADNTPIPNGPPCTDELRKYRFKPDLF